MEAILCVVDFRDRRTVWEFFWSEILIVIIKVKTNYVYIYVIICDMTLFSVHHSVQVVTVFSTKLQKNCIHVRQHRLYNRENMIIEMFDMSLINQEGKTGT